MQEILTNEEWKDIGIWIAVLPLLWIIIRILYTVAQRALVKKSLFTEGIHLPSHFSPATALLMVSTWLIVGPLFFQPLQELQWYKDIARILFILSVTWYLIRVLDLASRAIYKKFEISHHDNLRSRKVRTQLEFIQRLIDVILIVVGVSLTLLTFDSVRTVGTSLLASAGIASVIIGFAAQKSLGNLIAGFQVAFTQPIRVDDVVIVEGEWGRIEEITLTYVVVRIWDLRRLIVPIGYFLEKPFENWTRTSAELLGYVIFHFDYRLPIERFREVFKQKLKEDPLWDGEVANIQVIDASEQTIAVRALMSARDSSQAWELRCNIREAMINFVRESHPEALPHLRITSSGFEKQVTTKGE